MRSLVLADSRPSVMRVGSTEYDLNGKAYPRPAPWSRVRERLYSELELLNASRAQSRKMDCGLSRHVMGPIHAFCFVAGGRSVPLDVEAFILCHAQLHDTAGECHVQESPCGLKYGLVFPQHVSFGRAPG